MKKPAKENRRQYDVALGIVGALGSGALFGAAATPEIVALLLQLHPRLLPSLADWLAQLAAGGAVTASLPVPDGPAQRIERNLAPAWLALYLVAASERLAAALAEGPTALEAAKQAEERYFSRHVQAETRRQRAAALQDMAQTLNSDRESSLTHMLGWRAVLDNRTTPECRYANGRNFQADQMPIIGWPGAVHMRCRCSAGPAVPGAPILPSV